MPHCIVEITENIFSEKDAKLLMKDIAGAIFSLACFNADDIKVRLYPVKYSFLGIEEQEHSYVTAEVFVMENKSESQLNELAENIQKVLLKRFNNTFGKTSITTQINFLNKFYKRFKNF